MGTGLQNILVRISKEPSWLVFRNCLLFIDCLGFSMFDAGWLNASLVIYPRRFACVRTIMVYCFITEREVKRGDGTHYLVTKVTEELLGLQRSFLAREES